MIEFSDQLEERLTDLCKTAVGEGTDATNFVKTFDNYLHDIEISDYPYIALSVRTGNENPGLGELTTQRDIWTWYVHIYYMDVQEESTYADGKKKRSNIMSRVEKQIIQDRRLGNLEVTDDESGYREYVWDTHITNVLFDYTGQEDYHVFVSEMYVEVHSGKT